LRPGIALIGFLVCLLAGIGLTCAGLPALAATTERIVVNRFSGVAIEGFDPVAYFVDGAAVQGTAEFEANLWGAVWRFRNEGNRASSSPIPRSMGRSSAATIRPTSPAASPSPPIPVSM